MWVASYVVLWLAVLVLTVAVIALLRQIGVLHARLHPLGAHFGGEGPALESSAPPVDGVDYARSATTLLAFTSPTCEVCKVLAPSLDALRRDYRDVQVHTVDLDRARSVFDSFQVRSTPYVELTLAVAMVLAPITAIGALILLGAFTIVLVGADEGVRCACFGSASSEPVSWVQVVRNGFLAAAAAVASGATPRVPSLAAVLTTAGIAAIALLVLALADLKRKTGAVLALDLP